MPCGPPTTRARPSSSWAAAATCWSSDEGFAGTVVEVASRGVEAEVVGRRSSTSTVAAGEPWDAVVAHAVANGWSGIEALSGIPGRVGATPIQNVGAYGQDVVADGRVGARAGPGRWRGAHPRRRRLRLRLPDEPVQGGRRHGGSCCRSPCGSTSRARGVVRYAELARALGVEPWRIGRRSRRSAAAVLGASRAQGDGARRRRPRHLERRLVLHQPRRRRRGRAAHPRRLPALPVGRSGRS